MRRFRQYGYVIVLSPRRQGKSSLLEQIILENYDSGAKISLFSSFTLRQERLCFRDHIDKERIQFIHSCRKDGSDLRIFEDEKFVGRHPAHDICLFDEVIPPTPILKRMLGLNIEFAVAATPPLLVTSWYGPMLKEDEDSRRIAEWLSPHDAELELDIKLPDQPIRKKRKYFCFC
jgi:hypothetical protein